MKTNSGRLGLRLAHTSGAQGLLERLLVVGGLGVQLLEDERLCEFDGIAHLRLE